MGSNGINACKKSLRGRCTVKQKNISLNAPTWEITKIKRSNGMKGFQRGLWETNWETKKHKPECTNLGNNKNKMGQME